MLAVAYERQRNIYHIVEQEHNGQLVATKLHSLVHRLNQKLCCSDVYSSLSCQTIYSVSKKKSPPEVSTFFSFFSQTVENF